MRQIEFSHRSDGLVGMELLDAIIDEEAEHKPVVAALWDAMWRGDVSAIVSGRHLATRSIKQPGCVQVTHFDRDGLPTSDWQCETPGQLLAELEIHRRIFVF